jgi:hypothetical protein
MSGPPIHQTVTPAGGVGLPRAGGGTGNLAAKSWAAKKDCFGWDVFRATLKAPAVASCGHHQLFNRNPVKTGYCIAQ